jgi:hypothetical protein
LRKKGTLTNEKLKYKFKNFFDLSNYGIKLAREKILKDGSVTLSDVIDDLLKLPDQFVKPTY